MGSYVLGKIDETKKAIEKGKTDLPACMPTRDALIKEIIEDQMSTLSRGVSK